MVTKTTKLEKLVIGICIGLLMCVAFSIMLRFFTRHILVNYLGMHNEFIELVWFDNKEEVGFVDNEQDESEESEEGDATINWSELYPFDNSKSNLNIDETNLEISDLQIDDSNNSEDDSTENIKLVQYTSVVTSVENKIESFATDWLPFYSKMVEGAQAYEQYIGWNYAYFGEYNGIVRLSDGYLTSYVSKQDTSQQYEALAELNEFCQNEGIDFLYVQAPYKISEYDDTDVSGTVDFSNQNADELLEQLGGGGIDYYDIRETIHENNLYNHDLFYKTDHHWTTTTGLWAAQNILAYCNENYSWNADLSLLNADQFDYVTYEGKFVGSQGKKVTLARCVPEDFTFLYPKYETSFHYYIPSIGLDKILDYSEIYSQTSIDSEVAYSCYSWCNYGDQPLIQIENQLPADNHKILIISNSFSDSVISCLALAEKNVDSIDRRYFTGSIKTYIEESNPDTVIVMYPADAVGGDVYYPTHKHYFDFM